MSPPDDSIPSQVFIATSAPIEICAQPRRSGCGRQARARNHSFVALASGRLSGGRPGRLSGRRDGGATQPHFAKNDNWVGLKVGNCKFPCKKIRGRFPRPLVSSCSCLVFLFLLGFLLGCHESILPFHFSWIATVFCCN